MSGYDEAAASFDRDRPLPDGVPQRIRQAILDAVALSRPRLLDVGAGTGRIAWPFVAEGDDYVGVDLSLAMLRRFAARRDGETPRLVLADGARLPFRDAGFDAVMLMQVFGGLTGWRGFMADVRRVLAPTGRLIVGHTSAPADSLDTRMKQRLATILADMGVPHAAVNARQDVERWLDVVAAHTRVVAAEWDAPRTPRRFLARHRGGARFSALPDAVKDGALQKLAVWAADTFGSLDAELLEPRQFELRIHRFHTHMERRHAG
jgi:ubiquinone/menaquinone biosynthesis C-methylase UbiE